MNELELLGIGRAVFAVIIVIFALRARYWWLLAAGAFGLTVSILVSLGVDPITTARLAYGLYGCLAVHALDVTRRMHPRRLKS